MWFCQNDSSALRDTFVRLIGGDDAVVALASAVAVAVYDRLMHSGKFVTSKARHLPWCTCSIYV